MFFHFAAFIYSIGFALLLELLLREPISKMASEIFFSKPLLLLIAMVFFIGYLSYVTVKVSKRFASVFTAIILGFSSLGLLSLIDSIFQKHLFIGLISVIFYLFLLGLYRLRVCKNDKTALSLISAVIIAISFLFYTSIMGMYLNFAISLWILMLIVFFVMTFLTSRFFKLLSQEGKKSYSYGMILGFVMMEIIWVANFWPFGYLTTGVIILIFYYVFWDIMHSHFTGILSKRRIVANLIFFGFLTCFVLISSKWLPVV